MSDEIQCPECQGILILEGRVTNYGLIWYFECNKCEKKFTESEIRKDIMLSEKKPIRYHSLREISARLTLDLKSIKNNLYGRRYVRI